MNPFVDLNKVEVYEPEVSRDIRDALELTDPARLSLPLDSASRRYLAGEITEVVRRRFLEWLLIDEDDEDQERRTPERRTPEGIVQHASDVLDDAQQIRAVIQGLTKVLKEWEGDDATVEPAPESITIEASGGFTF
jgi:hypothetical protein